jgi:hypothetical protein
MTFMRLAISSILSLLLILSWLPSNAGIVTMVTGEIKVEVETAPVRVDYPAGRILTVLHRGDVVQVVKAWENGDGVWLEIKVKIGEEEQSGYVAKNQTNFKDQVNLSEVNR